MIGHNKAAADAKGQVEEVEEAEVVAVAVVVEEHEVGHHLDLLLLPLLPATVHLNIPVDDLMVGDQGKTDMACP